MRVTNVALYSSRYSEAAALDFTLKQQDKDSRYIARAILGLDAEEIIPKFYGFGLASRARFYEYGLKPRDIVIRAALNPKFYTNETYSEIRDELYRAISTTRDGIVMVHFRSGAATIARIPGMITKFEVPYFSQTPEVQITITCNDPIFRGLNPVIYKPSEMSVTNPIIIPDSISTAPHGFCFEVKFKATSPSFTIQDAPSNPDWKFVVTPSGGFAVNDELYFSSEMSSKFLYMVRGSTTTHLIDKIQADSIWPVIFPGSNTFHFVDIAKFDWEDVHYSTAFWGV